MLRVPGREPGPLRAVLAHKDEIGALVKRIGDDGAAVLPDARRRPSRGSGARGRSTCSAATRRCSGVLSFGARHVSEESPQRKQLDDTPLRWRDAWVETKLSAGGAGRGGRRAGLAGRAHPRAQAAGAAGRRRRVRRRLRARRPGRGGRAAAARRAAASPLPRRRARVHRPRGDRLPRRPVVRAADRRRGAGRARGGAGRRRSTASSRGRTR